MDIDKYLEQHMYTTLSSEGFMDGLRDFFATSNKGKDYKEITRNYTYNYGGLQSMLLKAYGNDVWLNKQNWNKGEIDGKNILEYFGGVTNLLKVVTDAGVAFRKVHDEWFAAEGKYVQALEPIAKILQDGQLSDAAYDEALAKLKELKRGDALMTPAKQFPIGPRAIDPTAARKLPDPEPMVGKLPALTIDQVRAVTAVLVKDIGYLWDSRYMVKTPKPAQRWLQDNTQFIEYVHATDSHGLKVPKGSTKSLKDWKILANYFDSLAIYWSSRIHSQYRDCYADVVLAAARWVDRSIK